MGLIEFLIVCAVIGVVVWALTSFLPMPDAIAKLMIAAAVLVCVLILLRAIGLDVALPRIR